MISPALWDSSHSPAQCNSLACTFLGQELASPTATRFYFCGLRRHKPQILAQGSVSHRLAEDEAMDSAFSSANLC